VPDLDCDDGVTLHWEQTGEEGPLVVVASYWSMHPSVHEPIITELAGDHRVVRYDDRHAGQSTHVGPYDLDTAAADMAAVIEAAGPPATIVTQGDGSNRAVRVLDRKPELVTAVVANGGIPIGRHHFEGLEALVTSEGVVEAILSQVETDYRGAIRGILSATNPQMSEEELRERVERQIAYSPAAAAYERLRAWTDDDPLELGRTAGDRLWVLFSEGAGGGWFPTGDKAQELVERLLPDAHHVEVDDGMVSRPDQTAAVVRRVTAEVPT
jgi:pimeloyl-ACP methyl ester carboxylesterase